MRKKFFIFCLLCFFIPQVVFAHQHIDMEKWGELNKTTDKVLQLVKEQKLADAKQLLQYFSEKFLTVSKESASLSMTELRMITNSYNEAQEAVTNVNLPIQDRIMKVTQLRLVIDAISNKHHPLWLNTKNSMLKAIEQLEELSSSGNKQAYEHQLNLFLQQYQMIRPALTVSLDETTFQKVDSLINYMDRNRVNHREHIDLLRVEFEKLYSNVKEDATDPSLLWVIFSISGMIFVSLSYVGWKKYQGEKRKKMLRQHVGKK